jgi:hypothetical protein
MRRQAGYAYLMLLFLLALLTLAALAVAQVEYTAGVRSDEAELLRIGGEFRRALGAYRDAVQPHVYPARLEDLLVDRRGGIERHHLRKLYFDPVTRSQEWGLVLEGRGIVGVHSLSERAPLKIGGFAPDDAQLAGAEHYSQWIFRAAEPRPDADTR